MTNPKTVVTGGSASEPGGTENSLEALSEAIGEESISDQRQLIDICSRFPARIEPHMLEIQTIKGENWKASVESPILDAETLMVVIDCY